MKHILTLLFCSVLLAGSLVFAFGPTGDQILSNIGHEPSTATYLKFNEAYVGDWQQYGEVFTNWQKSL